MTQVFALEPFALDAFARHYSNTADVNALKNMFDPFIAFICIDWNLCIKWATFTNI